MAVGRDPFLRGTPPAQNLGLRAGGPNPGIFETLTRLTPTFGVAPGLAVRWEALSPTRWRFVLRRGITFHDGTSLDAGAVVAALDGLARRRTPLRGLEPGSATVRDPFVVEVALSSPNLRLAEQLANPSTGIQAPGTAAGDGEDRAHTPTGTGPFRFVAYTPGVELRVAANDAYWGGPPTLRSLTFRFGPEGEASQLLATRQAEVVGLVPRAALARVSGTTDRLLVSPPGRAAYLLANVGGVGRWATLKEDAVRRAVGLAVDREAVTWSAWPEDGEPSATLVPPPLLGHSVDVRPPSHDREGARRLLDEAGWVPGPDGVRRRDGRSLALTLLVAVPEEGNRAATAVSEQLRRAGIAVEVPDPGPEAFAAFLRVNQATFDLLLDTRFQEDANPCSLCRFFSVRPGGQLEVAGAVRAGPEADALFDQVFTAPSVERARRVTADLMRVVTADRAVAIPIATLRSPWLVSPRVKGFDPAPLPGAQRWDGVWLSV